MNENVREKIDRIADSLGDTFPDKTPDVLVMAAEELYPTIIALVREAMLREEAVEAFNDAATFDYYGTRDEHMQELRGGITAALAAAGFEEEQGE